MPAWKALKDTRLWDLSQEKDKIRVMNELIAQINTLI